jgi:hypothetical protein
LKLENLELIFDESLITEEYKVIELINMQVDDTTEENLETETIDDWLELP